MQLLIFIAFYNYLLRFRTPLGETGSQGSQPSQGSHRFWVSSRPQGSQVLGGVSAHRVITGLDVRSVLCGLLLVVCALCGVRYLSDVGRWV